MRLWSLHPSYLDSKGLNGVWRESLLAQAVLLGRTTAWKKHSHLIRFKNHGNPIKALGYYLLKILEEAKSRGYGYDKAKIIMPIKKVNPINVTTGQLQYEAVLLMERLKNRDSRKYREILDLSQTAGFPQPHPLFCLIDGDVEPWEKLYQRKNEKSIQFTQL